MSDERTNNSAPRIFPGHAAAAESALFCSSLGMRKKKEEERIRFFFLLETTEMRSVAALGRSSHYAAHRSFYFPDFHRRRRVFQYQKRISRNGLARRSAVALSGQRTFRWPLPLLLSFLDETPKKRQSRAKGER